MDRSEFLEEYRRRVNEYARRTLQGDPPSVPCADERAQVTERYPDREADPWGYLHAMARVIAKHNPF